MNPALTTELVLCHSSIEAIRDERFRTAEQLELRRLDDQVDEAFFRAHRAIAHARPSKLGEDFEPHLPTVTPPGVSPPVGHLSPSLYRRAPASRRRRRCSNLQWRTRPWGWSAAHRSGHHGE